MRRAREVPSSRYDLLSGHDLYSIQGDSGAALKILTESQKEEKGTAAADYNCLLLELLTTNKSQEKDGFLKALEDYESQESTKKEDQLLSARKRQRNELIKAYNRALVLQASGETAKCAAICNEHLKDMISSKHDPSEELSPVLSRMGLLLLESLLGLSVGRNSGLDHERLGCPRATSIIEWLEILDSEKDPQLKFLLSLYKSRVDLSNRNEAGMHVDSKIRSARKELKSAMEIFQQKLRPSFGAETGSVVSSANSEENSTLGNQEHQQQALPSSFVLQKYNQSALSLKANLEQLKGNTKKSLILCSEAQSAAIDDGSYDAVHSNNLSVVYETNDKRHLALHALTKGLRANSDSAMFHEDGTARPNLNLTLAVLYNAAICALQAKNYLSAYECMAACVFRSEIFRARPRCWLRLAEACIGQFTKLRRLKSTKVSMVEINGYVYVYNLDGRLVLHSRIG